MVEFVMVVESEADFRIASELANRILVEQIEWIEPYLPELLQWRGLLAHTSFTCWKDIKAVYNEMAAQGIHLPSVRGKHQGADFAASRKILIMIEHLLKDKKRGIQALVLMRDLDNQPERRRGIEQARQEATSVTVVIGTADGKREAWVLNGFVCQDEAEETLLSQLVKQLAFNPLLEPHRLRAATFDEPDRIRNAKIVLEILTQGSYEREAQCWQKTDLALLRQRGVNTSLAAYVEEVEERLAPLLHNA